MPNDTQVQTDSQALQNSMYAAENDSKLKHLQQQYSNEVTAMSQMELNAKFEFSVSFYKIIQKLIDTSANEMEFNAVLDTAAQLSTPDKVQQTLNTIRNPNGQTLLEYALANQNFTAAKSLTKHGAIAGPKERACFELALDSKSAREFGYSPSQIKTIDLHPVKNYGVVLGIAMTSASDGVYSQYAHIQPTYQMMTDFADQYAAKNAGDMDFQQIANAFNAANKSAKFQLSTSTNIPGAGKELQEHLMQGKVTNIPISCRGNVMGLSIVPDSANPNSGYMVFTNRGLGKKANDAGTQIYRIGDMTQINPTFINSMITGQANGTSSNAIMKQINQVTGGLSPVYTLKQKDQKYDNGTIANPRSNVHGVLLCLQANARGGFANLTGADIETVRSRYKSFSNSMREDKVLQLAQALKTNPNDPDLRVLAQEYLNKHPNAAQNLKQPLEKLLSPSAQEIVQWAKSFFGNKDKSTADLSRFGLKNPFDVIKFLLSPAGRELRKEIMTHIIHELQIKEAQTEAYLEKRRGLIGMASFFALLFGSKRAHAHDKAYAEAEAQNKKSLDQLKKSINNPQSATANAKSPSLPAKDTDYSKLYDQLMDSQKQLDDRIQNHEALYNTYKESLNDFENSLLNDSVISKENISELYDKLNNSITNNEKQISLLANKGDNVAAQDLLTKTQLLKVEKQTLDLIGKDQQVVNADGTPSTFNEGEIFLQHDKQLVKDDQGQYFLLNKNQNLNELTLDEKQQANLDYQNQKELFKTQKVDIIDKQQAIIQQQLNIDADQISQINDKTSPKTFDSDMKRISDIMQKSNALSLKSAVLHDLKDVIEERKYFANSEGKPVTSSKDASLVLNKDEVVANALGKNYVIKKDQSLSVEIDPVTQQNKVTLMKGPVPMPSKALDNAEKGYIQAQSIKQLIDTNAKEEIKNLNQFMQENITKVKATKENLTQLKQNKSGFNPMPNTSSINGITDSFGATTESLKKGPEPENQEPTFQQSMALRR